MEKKTVYMGKLNFSAEYCGRPVCYSADYVAETKKNICVEEGGCTIYLDKRMLKHPVLAEGKRTIHIMF